MAEKDNNERGFIPYCKRCRNPWPEPSMQCERCGALLNYRRKRPLLVTVIAAFMFIVAALKFSFAMTLTSAESIMFGVHVPVMLTLFITLLSTGVMGYGAYGLMQLNRQAMIVLSVFLVFTALLTFANVLGIVINYDYVLENPKVQEAMAGIEPAMEPLVHMFTVIFLIGIMFFEMAFDAAIVVYFQFKKHLFR